MMLEGTRKWRSNMTRARQLGSREMALATDRQPTRGYAGT